MALTVSTGGSQSALAWLANVGSNYLVSGQDPKRYGNAHPNIVPYEVFACADGHLILAVGTRFVEPATAPWGLAPDRTVIQIDIDADEISRNYPASIGPTAHPPGCPIRSATPRA